MDTARTTISKIFNGEPRSYTRFNLTQNMEGDTSQVEMKLSSDLDDESGGNCPAADCPALNHRSNGPSYALRKHQRTPKNICFMVATVLLIFVIGYLIGYLVHRKKEVAPSCSAAVAPFDDPAVEVAMETGAAPLMDWMDVKTLLDQKLGSGGPEAAGFENTFSEFASYSHQAGSSGDEILANLVLKKFGEAGVTTWSDQHYVTLQDGPAAGYNTLRWRGEELKPRGYLAYSATGTAQGPVVYAAYGQTSELRVLEDKGINLAGKIILVRGGKISFAEKVANAVLYNASAVLIYPDPDSAPSGSTELYGHVHLGSGDPYTPGFPSFNHTQFPPVRSSGLPAILAQTITSSMADNILSKLSGQAAPPEWGVGNRLGGGEADQLSLDVNNVLAEKKIFNVFGVIKGYVDPDRYVVLGAQRDAFGPGFAKSTVGSSVLVELARAIAAMVENDDFKPRRSIVFASWSAGEFGSVGATEWLEGYLSSLNMKAFSYVNLDGVVTGLGAFKASASPMLYGLLQSTLKEVSTHNHPEKTLFKEFARGEQLEDILEPMRMDDPAYPFLSFSGIPSISFRFSAGSNYPYFGTLEDTQERLDSLTSNQTPQLAQRAATVAGQMALRLVHDHLLRLNPDQYTSILRKRVADLNRKMFTVQRTPGVLPKGLTVQWLMSAVGTFSRAATSLNRDVQNSNLDDTDMCRRINDRIMKVERDLLSPYVSPRDAPFRHLLHGSGTHTLAALAAQLEALQSGRSEADADLFRSHFALATWTIQGCANTLGGDVWAMDNQI